MSYAHCVVVRDKQQNKDLLIHANRAKYLSNMYPYRFTLIHPKQLEKELLEMARLAAKSPVLYQQKLTLEEVKDEDLTVVSIEEKEGTSGVYLLLRVKRADGKTGYISMGFAPIVEALQKLDYKKDLPGEIKFTKSGTSWIMV